MATVEPDGHDDGEIADELEPSTRTTGTRWSSDQEPAPVGSTSDADRTRSSSRPSGPSARSSARHGRRARRRKHGRRRSDELPGVGHDGHCDLALRGLRAGPLLGRHRGRVRRGGRGRGGGRDSSSPAASSRTPASRLRWRRCRGACSAWRRPGSGARGSSASTNTRSPRRPNFGSLLPPLGSDGTKFAEVRTCALGEQPGPSGAGPSIGE